MAFSAILFLAYMSLMITSKCAVTARVWTDGGHLEWATDCDFPGNNMSSIGMPEKGDDCGPTCASTPGCTHFAWNLENGGTCRLKRGPVSPDRSIYNRHHSMCGFLKPKERRSSHTSNWGVRKEGQTTRYWDCCKTSCGWGDKASVSSPVTSCQRNGWDAVESSQANSCDGGPSYTCNSNQPWAVNQRLSYGFSAVFLNGQGERDWCCACYELQFTSGPVLGQKMVVQVTNTGADLGSNHFNLQIPGGGRGYHNGRHGCATQWESPVRVWGNQYGGVSRRSECSRLPPELQSGCFWRFDWFKNADNPSVSFRRVKCPAELVAKSNCRRQDDM